MSSSEPRCPQRCLRVHPGKARALQCCPRALDTLAAVRAPEVLRLRELRHWGMRGQELSSADGLDVLRVDRAFSYMSLDLRSGTRLPTGMAGLVRCCRNMPI